MIISSKLTGSTIVFFVLFLHSHYLASQEFTLTNTTSGGNNIALGYTVPIPVDSMTPIAGFRTYESLHLRHLQLTQSSSFFEQTQVGATLNNLPIYAYTIGDSDIVRVSGGEEGAVLINGGIHAREWQSPEATTGFMEFLYDNYDDEHLAQYIIENLNFVVLPVLNIDGFLQTQRFPTTVTNSRDTPRDGRLRRKNMRNVDTSLATTFNNLNGIDLNRNNPPYWATSTRSSSDPQSLVYHGNAPSSEPETQALQQAASVAGESRLRMYIDTHSFTQIYFSHYTLNSRRNGLNDRLALIMRAANNNKYRYDPSPASVGIGSTDEYFAEQYQALSYTLETEPLSSAQEYGGFGVSHDGFILPNAEVPRMRQETTKATMAGLYAVSDVPFLEKVEIVDQASQELMFAATYIASDGQRELTVSVNTALETSKNYSATLFFNKPMRNLENNQVVNFANLSQQNDLTASLQGVANNTDVQYAFDVDQGQWLVDEDFNRYKTDAYRVSFRLPDGFNWNEHSKLAIAVETKDMTGLRLDANPSSLVDWSAGSWTNYEDSNGNTQSNLGGVDQSIRLIDDGSALFAQTPPTPTPTPNPTPPNTGGSSGGGTLGYFFSFLLLLIAYTRLKTIFVTSRQG